MEKYSNLKNLDVKDFYNLEPWCEEIYKNLSAVKNCFLIAGASSSGKGFSAEKLAGYLTQNGLKPLVISTDDFYKGVSRTIVENASVGFPYKNIKALTHSLTNALRSVIEFSVYADKFSEYNEKIILSKFKKIFKDNGAENPQLLSNKFYNEVKKEYENINYDLPSAVDLKAVADVVNKFNKGEKFIMPVYSFHTGEVYVDPENTIDPKDYTHLIVEGIFALNKEVLKNIENKNISTTAINCDPKTLLVRKLNRDVKIGRCSHAPEEIILNFLNQTMVSYEEFIKPSFKNANLVLNSNLSFGEKQALTPQKQVKFKISKSTYADIINDVDNVFLTEPAVQIDHFFDATSDLSKDIIVRVREENGKAVGLTIKIDEKDTTNRYVDEYDLKSILSPENSDIQTILRSFERAGFKHKASVKKERTVVGRNGFEFKLDNAGPLGCFVEFDFNQLTSHATSFCKRFNLNKPLRLPYLKVQLDYDMMQKATIQKEQEFKFMVDKLPRHYDEKLRIQQFYLNREESKQAVAGMFPKVMINRNNIDKFSEFRLRIAENKQGKKSYFLTLKSNGDDGRIEAERPLNESQANFLRKFALGKVVKNRYIVHENDLTFEFDEYENDNGLKTCEVEYVDPACLPEIENYLRNENIIFANVTQKPEYKNNNLAIEKFFE